MSTVSQELRTEGSAAADQDRAFFDANGYLGPFTVMPPEDVEALFVPVIGHRLMLAPELVVENDLTRDEAVQRVFEACKERAHRPEPAWGAEARAAEA